ncbi:hypothetical protein HBI24_114000 [Parastagonospora nodorum]|nr:hypothetical protein HBH51_066630 [Parastagonospora nodorum]KAH4170620.1 hypothetical protein HBH43_101010 [Parastagonospora nodorum]KAH4225041.1 hypothetical protein HBI06_123530 [Parastagonospora nodorum]KAH4225482.1 hypothetical protein HBI05_227360 [Parastagonospora nodorum]KAH4603695.1 hypothetical protein HBH82_150680 [Parastagonospora nodorum]
MLKSLPEIVIADTAAPHPKRRRLNIHYGGSESVAIESARRVPEREPSAQTTPTLPTCATAEEICENTLLCFGMVSDLTLDVPLNHVASPASAQHSICFEPPRTIRYGVADTATGRLDEFGGKLLLRLVADDELILQFVLSPAPFAPIIGKQPHRDGAQFLGVIVYGPRCRSSDVGDFMTKAGCYLDDPVACDRNVPYMNPQCLFSLYEPAPMTFEMTKPREPRMDNFARPSLDVLSGFETTGHLEPSANPTALRTGLKMHQRQALSFLMKRERGMHPNEDGFGIWLRKTNEGHSTFVNAVTGEARPTPGPKWRGGLLADEMGLGKTLEMIALVASDQDCISGNDPFMDHPTFGTSIKSTLIVVPSSLLNVWESQLRTHLHNGRLTWFVHHGKQRFKLENKTQLPDIIFTTYQIVEREYRINRSSLQSTTSIFSHRWRRVILDEAHMIRNHNTSTAQATAALQAMSRWAISGTPIQNSLLDLYGLFKFLHFSPYDDPKVFDDEISDMWRVNPVDEAAETFKKLLSCLMLRRTKAILDLPTRDDQWVRVPFSHEEQQHYRRIEQPVMDMLDRATESGSQTDVPWMTAIQQINKLRLVCNLGLSISSQPSRLQQTRSSDKKILSPSPMEWNYAHDISSKVWAVVSQIRSCPQEKHVVFSFWTSSLDMVEKALRYDSNHIVRSVRIDGKVQQQNRNHAIKQLESDPSIRVMLTTIGCGACGLDLTAASRVHLLEPQWNPSLEEQALARVHRLGQTRLVTTVRYVMEDSFEEHILKVQDRKKLLATTLLSNGSSIESLRHLFHGRKDSQSS